MKSVESAKFHANSCRTAWENLTVRSPHWLQNPLYRPSRTPPIGRPLQMLENICQASPSTIDVTPVRFPPSTGLRNRRKFPNYKVTFGGNAVEACFIFVFRRTVGDISLSSGLRYLSRCENANVVYNPKNVPVPPRKAAKRVASTPAKGAKAAKVARKKKEVVVEPDLRVSQTAGVVLSFGQGDVGQLGLGEDVFEKVRPAVIPGYQDIVGIAAGGMHNVCLTKSGKVLSFGCNDEGALGRDTSKEGSEQTPGFVELPGKVIQVTAGDSHSAALLEDGRVFAWGSFRDSHGNMGLTLKGNERLPVEMLPSVKVAKIASGADHLVLLTGNGHVYTCGCGEQGQLGRVAARTADRHNRQGIGPLLTPGLVSFKITKKLEFENIWAGTYCTFAKESYKGDIYVFGLNNYYQMGLKEETTHFRPQVSKTFGGREWRHISSGQHHTLALDEDGQVFAVGRKEYGRLGLGEDGGDAKEITLIPGLSSFKCIDVATGSAQSFAVTDTGELYAWGMGSSSALGTGEEDDVYVPTRVKGKQLEGKTVVRAAGGGQHTVILAISRPVKDKTAG